MFGCLFGFFLRFFIRFDGGVAVPAYVAAFVECAYVAPFATLVDCAVPAYVAALVALVDFDRTPVKPKPPPAFVDLGLQLTAPLQSLAHSRLQRLQDAG